MTDQFRELLHRRADNVNDVSLSSGAIHSGRKLKRTHNAIAGVAALVITAGVVGGYLTLKADGSDELSVPTDITTSQIEPWTELPETIVYGNNGISAEAVASLATGDQVEQVPLPYYEKEASSGSGAPWVASPNGHNVAARTAEGLRIGALDEAEDALVYSSQSLCEFMTWSPDSARVLVGECADETVTLIVVDALTGATTPIATELPTSHTWPESASAVWNADGSKLIWGNPQQGYLIANSDGSAPETFDAGTLPTNPADVYTEETVTQLGLGEDVEPFSTIVAVSPDGTRVCHSVAYAIPGYGEDRVFPTPEGHSEEGCNYVVDVPTGQNVTPDVGEAYFWGVIAFSAHGEIITRSNIDGGFQFRVDLFNADGEIIDSMIEPQYFESAGKGRAMLLQQHSYTN